MGSPARGGKPAWAAFLLVGCAQPVARPEDSGRIVPQHLPCPGQIWARSSGHTGPLVWDGQSFILHHSLHEGSGAAGVALEAWTPRGALRWSQPLEGPKLLWRHGGQTWALEHTHDLMAVSPEGELTRTEWVTLKGAHAPKVLPTKDGAWVVDGQRIWRVAGDSIVVEHAADEAQLESFGYGVVAPDGRLKVIARWGLAAAGGVETWVATFMLDGTREDAPVAPGFVPHDLAYDPAGRLVVAGTRLNDQSALGGRLLGLAEEPMDYGRPFVCRRKELENQGFGRLHPIPGGDWLVTGSTCAGWDNQAIWLLRLAPDGAVRWQAKVDLMNENTLKGAAVADDGTIALSGTVRECCYDRLGGEVPWLMFVDPEGQCLNAVR